MTKLQLGLLEKNTLEPDVIQVSLTLRIRLGLAKLKYEHRKFRHPNMTSPLNNDKSSDWSSGPSGSRCRTPSVSPTFRAAARRPPTSRQGHVFIASDAISAPVQHCLSDEEDKPNLAAQDLQDVSPPVNSSPPRTPLPEHDDLPYLDWTAEHDNEVELPSLAPNHGTPDYPFRFSEFVNATPSPVQPVHGALIPDNMAAFSCPQVIGNPANLDIARDT